MSQIPRPRDVIDRRALNDALDALGREGSSSRPAVAAALKTALASGRAEIRRRFDDGASGTDTVHATAFLMDQLIRALYDFTVTHVFPLANPTEGERMAVVAVGGYGRGELAPHSDIDLLFLLPYKATPHAEQVVEYMLYALWDLGLKVGQSTRSIAETIAQAKADLTIRTAILEARYIWGDQALFDAMKTAFDADIVKGAAARFVADKLKERNDRHQRLGDSRYVVEPNVKEGKGGLRDLHTLFWIAKFAYRVDDVAKLAELKVLAEEEAERFAYAQNFLWTVRCHLHFLSGRAEDRLTFEFQQEIARRMGYTDHAGTRGVERFMKHYFLVAKDVGDLTRIICAVLESEQNTRSFLKWPRWSGKKLDGFVVERGRIDVADEKDFERDPVNLLRIFYMVEQHGLDIHPHALRLITQNLKLIDADLRANPEANRLFMEIMTSTKDPEIALRRLNEAGVFGRFVPDFGRVVAQMQYDMYHIYTVDEHTIFAIGILAKIERGELKDELPLATSLAPGISKDSRRALYLAVLCHDIAKGRGGDHSVLGEEVALKLAPRLGLSAEETETVAWLVRWHLLMSATAFKLDIDDPKTIQDFVARVQSPERLKLLLLLTVVDIRAVGPKVWNGWKATLLRELYHRAFDVLAGGLVEEAQGARIAAAQESVRKLLPDFTPAEIDSFIAKGYAFYWLSYDPEDMARHAKLIRESERANAPLTVETRVDPSRSVTEVTVYTADHAGLFSRIAGALALAGANIVDAKILTMANGMALDSFTVQDQAGGAFDRADKLARLKGLFEDVLAGKVKPHVELAKKPAIPSRTRVIPVPPRVLVNNAASASYTVIEVNGRDRPGLLFEVTRALTGLNLQIASAKISTYGEKVVDVFYVRDLFGHKIEDESRLMTIRAELTSVLAAGQESVAAE